MNRLPYAALLLPLVLLLPGTGIHAQEEAESPPILDQLKSEAANLLPLMRSGPARAFLAAVPDLPEIVEARVVYYHPTTRDALSERDAAAKSEAALKGYERRELPPRFYYLTRYGTPLAFARTLELAAEAGFATIDGARIADFGFGTIGHPRLLASLGADVTGIDVDPILGALYSDPSDRGAMPRASCAGPGEPGHLRLVLGRFPDIGDRVGDGYDLFVSKNTLKRGYIHPPAHYERGALIDLGCPDEVWLAAIYRLLEPGGLFLIYNLSPAQGEDEASYIPWADGRSPFARDLFERTGFEVLAFDRDDTTAARAMGKALDWGGRMDLETGLFATFTLVRKR